MERTGIESVTSDLQIPGFKGELGQIGLFKAKLGWLGEIGIGYSGTRFGIRFDVVSGNTRRGSRHEPGDGALAPVAVRRVGGSDRSRGPWYGKSSMGLTRPGARGQGV